jgi:hypothetical protein
MSYTVYKHTVPNGKVYIGITSVDVNKRWRNGKGYRDNKQFYRDILLYGWLNIKHEILYSELTEAKARDIEARLICEYQSYKKKYGYNRDAGYVYGYIDRGVRTREEYLEYCKTEEYRKSCIPKNSKPVKQYKLDGTYIKTYPSIREAARVLKVDKKCIRECIKGKQKTCKGFIFKCDVSPPVKFLAKL